MLFGPYSAEFDIRNAPFRPWLGTSGRAKFRLVRKHDEKLGLLAVSSVFHHPRRDLFRRSESADCVLVWTTAVRGCAEALPAPTAQSSLPRNKTERQTKHEFEEPAFAKVRADK